MQIDPKTGLVLEGGGMRGIFTSGVLDYLMDHQIRFPYVIAVSAGACNGLSYMSSQRGRARYSNLDMMKEYHYIGMESLLKTGHIINDRLLYEDFPNRIYPYDYAAYASNPARFEMVATDCLTGKAVYLEEKQDEQRITAIVHASSSLPFICPMVKVDGRPMLDGGITDSIPLQRAYDQGYSRCVVVLTRNRGFRKSEKPIKLPHFIYRNYPQLREAILNRPKMYNGQLELVERLEEEGRITVIRPLKEVQVDRMERNPSKLEALYNEGYACAGAVWEKTEKE